MKLGVVDPQEGYPGNGGQDACVQACASARPCAPNARQFGIRAVSSSSRQEREEIPPKLVASRPQGTSTSASGEDARREAVELLVAQVSRSRWAPIPDLMGVSGCTGRSRSCSSKPPNAGTGQRSDRRPAGPSRGRRHPIVRHSRSPPAGECAVFHHPQKCTAGIPRCSRGEVW
jgi:hypothetical protein